jgi:hypothetical protein
VYLGNYLILEPESLGLAIAGRQFGYEGFDLTAQPGIHPNEFFDGLFRS